MRKAKIYCNHELAGILSYNEKTYTFEYNDKYYINNSKTAISLNLPKSNKIHTSKHLFPFFTGLLAEGYLKELQCKKLKIDPDDSFTRLLKTSHSDTIGPITVKEVKE